MIANREVVEMKLLLLSCRICDHWYKPSAHSGHCPVCATVSIPCNRKYFSFSIDGSKIREIKRGIPRININTKRALEMARELYMR